MCRNFWIRFGGSSCWSRKETSKGKRQGISLSIFPQLTHTCTHIHTHMQIENEQDQHNKHSLEKEERKSYSITNLKQFQNLTGKQFWGPLSWGRIYFATWFCFLGEDPVHCSLGPWVQPQWFPQIWLPSGTTCKVGFGKHAFLWGWVPLFDQFLPREC